MPGLFRLGIVDNDAVEKFILLELGIPIMLDWDEGVEPIFKIEGF